MAEGGDTFSLSASTLSIPDLSTSGLFISDLLGAGA